jgi:hypothetical protein
LWASCLSFTPDHALDSILDAWDLPVNQEADGTSAQLEIGKQLGSMDGMNHNEQNYFLCGLRGLSGSKLKKPINATHQHFVI